MTALCYKLNDLPLQKVLKKPSDHFKKILSQYMLFVCCISLWELFIYTPKWVQQWDTYSKKVITENQNFQVCKPLNILCNKINDITCKTKKYSIKMNPEFSQNVYLNPKQDLDSHIFTNLFTVHKEKGVKWAF